MVDGAQRSVLLRYVDVFPHGRQASEVKLPDSMIFSPTVTPIWLVSIPRMLLTRVYDAYA